VPSEAFTHTLQTGIEAPQQGIEVKPLPQVAQKRLNRSVVRLAKLAAASAKQPSDSRDSQGISSPNFVASPSLASEPAAQAAPASTLHIEIISTANEGALAIFADRELLFTTNLVTTSPGEPIHFEHALPAGSHQLRVALYKPDKSLRLEKEGLAEIRSDLANTLAVHVNRHSKLLVRHEWPWMSPGPPHPCQLPNAPSQLQKLLL